MCGIIGYVGGKKAAPLLLEGLKRLEYRGYDSAGIATIADELQIKKDQGEIDEIDGKLNFSDLEGNIGVGHTRWSTHGEPSRKNAHPHLDESGEIAVVHNGIIENYKENREFLESKGYELKSETDTEVIPHLINYFLKKEDSLREAIRLTTQRLKGSYALAIVSAENPNRILVVRKQSPLIIGLGEDENFVASDIPAILPHTDRTLILENGEIGILTQEKIEVEDIETGATIEKEVKEVDWTVEMAEKGGYDHFMLKEIHEQANAIQNTLRAPEEELDQLSDILEEANNVYLVACGTSYHAALVGKYALAKLAGITAEAVISSEFQESCMPQEGDVILAVTQSGETADTLKAVRVAKESGAKISSLTNTVGSSVTRMSDLACLIRAGPEIGVAATKTFTSQVAYLLRFAYHIAKRKGNLTEKEYQEKISQIKNIPDLEKKVLDEIEPETEELAEKYKEVTDSYFIGRGIAFPIAKEGALKLKEIAYIHSSAHPAGELKHGPLALIEEGSLVFALVTPGAARDRMLGNIEEVKARGADVLTLASEGDQEIKDNSEEVISLPAVPELFSPLIYILPLQLLSYYIGLKRGHDPDKPRHLAKSVTVE